MKSFKELTNEVQRQLSSKASLTAEEIYSIDRKDDDVKEFLEKFDISPDSETYLRGRSSIHRYLVAKGTEEVMLPTLTLYNGHIHDGYTFKSGKHQERFTKRPKARYDTSVSHLRGLTMNDIEVNPYNSGAMSYLTDFLEVYMKSPKQAGMWLQGSMGIGKTYLMGCFAGELINNNIGFEFIGANQFLSDLKQLMASEGHKLEVRKNELKTQTPILIIDDIGIEQPTIWNVNTYQDILQYRYDNQLPTFFTTNLTKADYCSQLIKGGKVERATVERFYKKVLNPATIEVGMGGYDRRQKQKGELINDKQ